MFNSTEAPWNRLLWAALLSLTIHFVAGLAMALVLRHGLETNPELSERLRFIVEHPFAWVLAWLSWQAAALSILWFFLCFESAHAEHQRPGFGVRWAVVLVAAAIVPDLVAESVEMGVVPDLARRAVDDREPLPAARAGELYETVHRTTVMLTGYLANGLYTLGTVLAVWATRRSYPPWTWLAGLAVGVLGLALSVSALADSLVGLIWSNALLVPAIVAWQFGVFIDAWNRSAGRKSTTDTRGR